MVSHIHDRDLDLDPRVRELLHAAAAPTEPGPMPGEAEAVAAFRAARPRTRRKFMPSSLPTVRAAVAAGLGTGLIVAGLALPEMLVEIDVDAVIPEDEA